MKSKIHYTKPSITELEVSYATDAARNGWGEMCYEYINKFEDKFKEFTGAKYAIATSSCTGAMGFALPTALGVAVQSQNKVVVITGDGSLQINIQELDTLNRLGLDMTIIVMNNSVLGMVKNFQDMYFDGRDQSTRKGYSSPSFTDIAMAYGIKAHRVVDVAEMDCALSLIVDHKGPLLIEIMMDGATECRPRLAFGSRLDEQFPKLND